MIEIFTSIKGLLKIESVCVDNNVFRLHYKLTALLLCICSILVTCRQYIGDPIDCIVDDIPSNIMDTYCWIYSTFTLPNQLTARIGKDVVQAGVGTYVEGEGEVRKQKYYQWVCFVLFFQAIIFYLPRYVWKLWEGGRIKSLVMDLNQPIVYEDVKAERTKLLIEYFAANLHAQNFYAMRFFLCEFFNLVNVFGQMYFMDTFLGGEFSTYGLDVWGFSDLEPEHRSDPMSLVFPKVTKCTFHKYGPSGSIQKLDGLCVLSVNILNEKIYVILWFWFMLLGVISAFHMVYRIIVVCCPSFRALLLRARSRLAPQEDIDLITKKCRIGDWFVLYQMGKNINPVIFREFLSELVQRLDGKRV